MEETYKIDVHHHVIPPLMEAAQWGANMDVPKWTVSNDKSFSQSIGVRTSILSVSAPGISGIEDPEENANAARSLNEYCASLRDQDPLAYGFFATVPSLEHTELAIREIRYALDNLHADGVTLFTWYGTSNGYLGNEKFVPIWEELNRREAVVFVHPINNNNPDPFNEKLPNPAFDWPHETGRTAMDLIVNRRLQQFPNVKIILSHAGGTLPLLATRATLISQPEFGAAMSVEDILNQAKSFYFDLALSGSPEVLPLILGFAKDNHLLFGSDYPHATVNISSRNSEFIDEFEMKAAKRKQIYHGAAEELFPRFKNL